MEKPINNHPERITHQAREKQILEAHARFIISAILILMILACIILFKLKI